MRLFFLLSFLLTSVFMHADEEEIFIQLSSEVELIPIFVSSVDSANSKLGKIYAEEIRKVFLFDIDNNGSTRALMPKEVSAYSSLANQNQFDGAIDFSKLKADGVLYLTKLKINGNELIAKIVSVNGQTANTIDHIILSGDLNKDRVKVHQLTDSIHKLLFSKPGIAMSRILYTSKRKVDRPKQEPKYLSEVYISDYDGHNVRQLTNTGSLCANPMFIPNSSNFLYVSYLIGQPKIYISSLNNTKFERVSPLRANQVTPGVSPDGTMLAFASDVTGKADIFIQPVCSKPGEEVKPRQIFTATAAANASPTFSPDGKRIAFVSNKDGTPKIYIMNIPSPTTKLKDIKLELISRRCRENTAPCWSPDGKKIAYCSRNGTPERQIWVYDFETKTERQITEGKSNKENPVWASNSLHLLFNSTDSHGTEIYLMNLNQPKAVKITSGPGVKIFPAWEPTSK